MGEYFSSFIVEPVVRQARRLSRLSTSEETPRFLPTVPESFRTWYPVRLWNASPPASISEDDDNQEDCSGPTPKLVGQWATPIPSPPLEAMDTSEPDVENREQTSTPPVAPFPPLEPQIAQHPRPALPSEDRAHSDTSINPLRELPDRSRLHEEDVRGHSQSDPIARTRERSGASGGASPVELARAYYENDGQTRLRDGSGTLPEDDGMGPLRKKINAIWQGAGTVEFKSQRLHSLMTEQYNKSRLDVQGFSPLSKGTGALSRPSTPSSLRDSEAVPPGSPMSVGTQAERINTFNLSSADLTPTHAPPEKVDRSTDTPKVETVACAPQLGCMHYKRNIKLQCFTCHKWYTCRFCHDDAEDHVLPRQETRNMLCMLCSTPQPASQTCKACGEQAACYYCSVCKLWNNDPAKSIYHCDDCGICRLGKGQGKDFFHCKTCAVCMSIGVQWNHRCIERSTKCDCPICGDYMFTSAGTVVFMRCGHSIHASCFREWCKASYKCPICSKSVVNMESQFRSLDRQIASQPMPEEYLNTRAYVHCNDCFVKGTTQYHWLGLKCELCESYNTQQHYLIEGDGSSARVVRGEGGMAPVTASPPLPQNVSDEAVAIPNSTAASRRPSISMSEVAGSGGSPWLAPQSRGARSVSPTGGNYFGTGTRREDPVERATEEMEYDFWGRPIRQRQRPAPLNSQKPEDEAEGEDEDDWTEGDDDEDDDDDDDDDEMEDDGLEDDEDDVDEMALLGHR